MEKVIRLPAVTRRNLYFILIIVALPLVLSFGLPLILYGVPIRLQVLDEAVQLTGSEILHATAVWVTWVAIAVLTPLVLSRFAPCTTYERHWRPSSLLRGYVILSLGGAVVAPAMYLVRFPGGIEQLFHQLSLAPMVAAVLGIQVLRDLPQSNLARQPWVIPGVILLLVLNLANAIILPVLFGRAAPAVFAGLGILFGLYMLRISAKKLVVGWMIFLLLTGLFMTYRGNFRTSGLGSIFWSQGEIRPTLADAFQGRALDMYRRALSKSDLTPGKTLRLEFDPNFPKSDINFRNIWIFPDDESFDKVRYPVAKILYRINYLGELAYAIRVTPEVIPYLNGTTYLPLLFKPIPRFLWADKPVDNSGQLYGHRYGRIAPTDKATSANMGVVIEAWINGGWLAVVLSSLAFGILIYFAWRLLIGESTNTGNVLLATVFLVTAVGTESSMNLVMGGMLYTALVWWVIEHLIRTRL